MNSRVNRILISAHMTQRAARSPRRRRESSAHLPHRLRRPGVDGHLAVVRYALDGAFGSHALDAPASHASVDLVSLDHGVHGDDLHLLGHVREDLLAQSARKHNGIVLLLGHLALGPLLLSLGLAAGCGSKGLCGLGLLGRFGRLEGDAAAIMRQYVHRARKGGKPRARTGNPRETVRAKRARRASPTMLQRLLRSLHLDAEKFGEFFFLISRPRSIGEPRRARRVAIAPRIVHHGSHA